MARGHRTEPEAAAQISARAGEGWHVLWAKRRTAGQREPWADTLPGREWDCTFLQGEGLGAGGSPSSPPFPSCPLAALLYMRLQLKRLWDLHLTPSPGQGNKETVCLSGDSRAPHAGDGWPGRLKACRRSPEEGDRRGKASRCTKDDKLGALQGQACTAGA